jgi:RNA-binding protein YlmH
MCCAQIGQRDLFEARVLDAIEKYQKGTVATLSFLTPGERKRAERILCAAGVLGLVWSFGGYPDAERASLFLLPEYLTDCLSAPLNECGNEEISALLGEELDEAVCAVRIKGSGFRTLSHRDFLGSILGLGIARDALGDVAVQDAHTAVVFCPRTLARFLLTSLERVGSDAVRVFDYVPDEHFTDGRNYQPVSDTVSSARLDCVVAALCRLSRGDAAAAIQAGRVTLRFLPCESVSTTVCEGDVLSVRGCGKFRITELSMPTRKGRLVLKAQQYM